MQSFGRIAWAKAQLPCFGNHFLKLNRLVSCKETTTTLFRVINSYFTNIQTEGARRV
jgi:hypothetical protein